MNLEQKLGAFGEKTIADYLLKNGYQILERNFRKKWGEIDIIAEKDGVIHFVEVKTGETRGVRPEENITPHKKHQLFRAIQTYILEKQVSEEQDFQLDAGIVVVDSKQKKVKIRYLEDIR